MPATIMPSSELLRRAVVYIDEERRENPEKSLSQVIDEAGMRFNLSPLDSEALFRLFSSGQTGDTENPS